MARTGSLGGNYSGDIFLAFSTANPGVAYPANGLGQADLLPNNRLDPIFGAAALAAEEAILNALLAAETMTGRDGLTVHALPQERLQVLLQQHNRLLQQ